MKTMDKSMMGPLAAALTGAKMVGKFKGIKKSKGKGKGKDKC